MRPQILLAVPLLITSSLHGAVTVSSTTPTLSSSFSDGSGDYFGLIDASGDIGGTNISTSLSPPEGSVAGEDLDGEGGTGTETATWTIVLPGDAAPGTGLTSINFAGVLAGRGGAWDSTDGIDFAFTVGGSAVDSISFRWDDANDNFNGALAIDTTGDGFGDGTTVSTTGLGFSFSDAGGSSITSVTVVMTASSNGGDEEFWASGNLSASYEQIPEPSATLLGGLGLLALLRRRR